MLSEGSIVSGGGINGAEVLGTRYLHIGEVDIETTCSLNIMDFDEIIIAGGAEANLNSVAMTRFALTLQKTKGLLAKREIFPPKKHCMHGKNTVFIP